MALLLIICYVLLVEYNNNPAEDTKWGLVFCMVHMAQPFFRIRTMIYLSPPSE